MDPALTNKGIADIHTIDWKRDNLPHIHHLFSSTLRRAIETALHLPIAQPDGTSSNLVVNVLAGIKEFDKTYVEDLEDTIPSKPITQQLRIDEDPLNKQLGVRIRRVNYNLVTQSQEWKVNVRFLVDYLTAPPSESDGSIPRAQVGLGYDDAPTQIPRIAVVTHSNFLKRYVFGLPLSFKRPNNVEMLMKKYFVYEGIHGIFEDAGAYPFTDFHPTQSKPAQGSTGRTVVFDGFELPSGLSPREVRRCRKCWGNDGFGGYRCSGSSPRKPSTL